MPKFEIFYQKFRFQNFKYFEFQNSDFEFGFRIKFHPRSNFGQNFDFKNFDFKRVNRFYNFDNFKIGQRADSAAAERRERPRG